MPNSLTVRGAKGNMLKAVYDTDNDGDVDTASRLQGSSKAQVQDHDPKSHGHPQSDVTDLETHLDGKAPVVHGHPQSDVTDLETHLDGKAPVVHGHPQSDVTDLETHLDGKAPVVHGHTESQISDLDHDAQKIKAVTVDDTNKANEKVLAYNQAEDTLAYVPKCPEIVIKAIQHVLITIPLPDTSAQTLINEVNLDNTFLIFSGRMSSGGGTSHVHARIELIDSTHIRATRWATGVASSFKVCVVECTAGIKSIQRGTIICDGVLYNDATITQVDTDKSFVSYLGVEARTILPHVTATTVYLLNSTTIRAERQIAADYIIVSYQVVEFL